MSEKRSMSKDEIASEYVFDLFKKSYEVPDVEEMYGVFHSLKNYDWRIQQSVAKKIAKYLQNSLKEKKLSKYVKISLEGYEDTEDFALDELRDKAILILQIEDEDKEKQELIIIKALPFRFLQEYVHSVPTYNKESLERVLKGYEVIGVGAFTVGLYNKELREKYESQIILLSQDSSKEILSYIHMLYPKNPHFPALKLLAKSKYFPPNVEKPIYQRKEEPVYVYSVPEYDALIFDKKKKIWYRIASEKLRDKPKGKFWKFRKKDMKPLFKDEDKKVIEQLNFIKQFGWEATKASVWKTLYVDSEESLDILSKMKANKYQQSVKNALEILIDEHSKFNKLRRIFSFTWDIRQIEGDINDDFLILLNVAIDTLAENIILLDTIVLDTIAFYPKK